MQTAVALGMVLLWALPGIVVGKSRPHTSPKSQAAVRKTLGKSAKTGTKQSGKRTVSSRKGRKSRAPARSKARRQTWRTGQMQPTPDRYREIQRALVAKGYSSATPDGVWGPQWVESLKRFQQEQKLEPNGKLTSLSLITLGLGSRRESGAPPVPSTGSPSTVPVTRE